MKRLVTILLWSAISAAFIGPGTVTTAAASGAGYGFALLWALLFSTLACLTLQEASARLTIASGKPLARAIGEIFVKSSGAGRFVPLAVVGTVVLGCAAYQAGNILGAKAGVSLRLDLMPSWLQSEKGITLAIGLGAAVILLAGTSRGVARMLGIVVALMGTAFLVCAIRIRPDPGLLVEGCFIPAIPPGSGLLALGLVGTTVVPYNLFLGSGLAQGQTMGEARLGLAVAIPLGGLISMGILVAGTTVEDTFSFAALSGALDSRLGSWAGHLFAFGLFAAGLSSAVTAPLAAALSVKGYAGKDKEALWKDRSWRYVMIWAAVIAFGLGFGLSGVKPIPAILLAQALNGVLLPFVAIFLWIAVNDRKLMGSVGPCGWVSNLFMGFSVLVALLLGCSGVLRAGFSVLNLSTPSETSLLIAAGAASALLSVPILKALRKRRGK